MEGEEEQSVMLPEEGYDQGPYDSKAFLKSDDGPTAIDYALIASPPGLDWPNAVPMLVDDRLRKGDPSATIGCQALSSLFKWIVTSPRLEQ